MTTPARSRVVMAGDTGPRDRAVRLWRIVVDGSHGLRRAVELQPCWLGPARVLVGPPMACAIISEQE
jgi:hypothetical protein